MFDPLKLRRIINKVTEQGNHCRKGVFIFKPPPCCKLKHRSYFEKKTLIYFTFYHNIMLSFAWKGYNAKVCKTGAFVVLFIRIGVNILQSRDKMPCVL